MSEFNDGPLPYYENQSNEKIGLFSDAASLILDSYGRPSADRNGRPLTEARWRDEDIGTHYILCRYQPSATVSSNELHIISLVVAHEYPNGEQSVDAHVVHTATKYMEAVRHLQRTTDQQAEYESRARSTDGQKYRLSPPDILDQEHRLELLLGVLGRGFELLEDRD